MQINLTQEHTVALKRIKQESKGLFSVAALVNLIIDDWFFRRDNEARLKAIYAPTQKPVSRK